MEQSLFVNRQLNYDEAVRRLEHGISHADQVRAKPAIFLLLHMLKRDRNHLYFEGR